jgi:hypothetical protein
MPWKITFPRTILDHKNLHRNRPQTIPVKYNELHSYIWSTNSGFDGHSSLLGCYGELSAKQVQIFLKILVCPSSGSTVRWLDCLTLKIKELRAFETSGRPNIPEPAIFWNKFSSAKHSEGALPACCNLSIVLCRSNVAKSLSVPT